MSLILRLKRKPAFLTAFFVGLCLSSAGVEAKTVTLVQFLGALETSPELAAADAAVAAVEASLAQAQNPVALELGVSSNAQVAEPAPLADTRVGISVTAYPFHYGQVGDVIQLRELDLERSQLDRQEVRAQLEARALESALVLALSRRSLGLTRPAAAAAAASYRAVQLRFDRGLATPAELRDAAAGQQRARNLVLNAEADARLARATLTSLVGDVELETLPELAPPRETLVPPTVRRAELEVAAAQLGRAGAARPFYPVAEITYDYDVSAQNRLSASISSSDLAPRVGYSYDFDGYGEDPRLSLRLSATLAPEQFDNVTRLTALERSAEASLEAARQNARVTAAQLRTRQTALERDETLAALVFSNAERSLSEVREREALGAGTPLETQAAAVALAEAGLEVRDARRDAASARLDLYRFFGLPLSSLTAPATPDLEKP